MSEKIWTAGTCLKKDLFSKLIEILQIGGWTLLTASPTTASAIHMHSTGISGDKNIYLQLKPFDGNTTSVTYDIRTTNYTDFLFEFGTAYNPTTKVMTTLGEMHVFSFIAGRRDSTSTSYGRQYDREWVMEYWYYVDKDRLIFICEPGPTTTLPTYTALNFLGIPEDMYLNEYKVPVYSGTVFAPSHVSIAAGKFRIVERPANMVKQNATSSVFSSLIMHGNSARNIDGVVQLSDVYFGNADEGIRGRLGGFYLVPPGLLDGDTVEIIVGGVTHVYLHKLFGPQATSTYSSYPTSASGVLIRMQ